jgi:divalent metal cation (Fe/Co/Zn/Cd) transporter
VSWFRESRTSALIVVFGEDVAALAGLVLALIAIVATLITGNPIWDAIGTIMIGVLLIIIAFFIAVEVKALLIGQSVDPQILKEMREFLGDQEEVEHIYNILTLQFGPDAMVAIKARMMPRNTDRELINTINELEKRFRARFESVRWLFFEPDIAD